MPKLILASASPRRKDLLQQIGVVPDVIDASDIDEQIIKREKPRQYVKRMAEEKARCVSGKYPKDFILAADTIVVCGSKILPKAKNAQQVAQYLTLLSGRQHTVMTAICVITPDGKLVTKVASSKIRFKSLSQEEVALYASCKEGEGKAGGYAIQGAADAFVKSINGSYSNVVGLPLYEVKNLLTGLGCPTPYSKKI